MDGVIRRKFSHLIVEKFKNETSGNKYKFKNWFYKLHEDSKKIPQQDNSIPKLDVGVLKKWLAAYDNKGGHNKTLHDLMYV
jgi:hypothetical protein